jgi:competence protein ComGC
MSKFKHHTGLTLIEVLMLLGILVCICLMIFPAIQSAREQVRRTSCINNMRYLGITFHNYHDKHKAFPAASGVTRNSDGNINAIDGWSWAVMILPYLEEDEGQTSNAKIDKMKLYESLDINNGRPLAEPPNAKGTPHADALATSIPGLLCPSFSCSAYSRTKPTREAIMNYKAMGATHIESLSIASPDPLTPKYRSDSINSTTFWNSRNLPIHPDGACYPGTSLRISDFMDGTAHTILAVESIEQQFARWTVGAEATVVGLPPNVEFENEQELMNYPVYLPKGYSKAIKKIDDADSPYWTYCTYLYWDYDKNPYDGAQAIKYGPSSNHPEVVNHLFADGACRTIIKDVDVSAYMGAITRNGGE